MYTVSPFLLFFAIACNGQNAGVERAKADANATEAKAVADGRVQKEALIPEIGRSIDATLALRAVANMGPTCVLLVDPQFPKACSKDGLPGTCDGALFAMRKSKWMFIARGQADTLTFPEHCHYGITLNEDWRYLDDLSLYPRKQ